MRVIAAARLVAGRVDADCSPKVAKINIKHIGPPAASDELIRSNLRVKAGDEYLRTAVDDDVRNLYATGFLYNIQVDAEETPAGVVLTYKVQGKPRLTAITFHGNTKTPSCSRRSHQKSGSRWTNESSLPIPRKSSRCIRNQAIRTPLPNTS